ncbi:MAG: RDD family protein [Candidatus Sulfotelmatobacter sp.]
MDQSPIFGSLSATEPTKPPTRYFAGFWRRLFAFWIDSVLITIPFVILGYIFHDNLSPSSRWAVVIGFVIALAYFAILGSSIGNGQTIGQRWTGIEVVDVQGNHLPIGKSALRYSILLVPLFSDKLVLPGYLAWPIGMAGLAIFYLYLFNTGTRQTLHDLATGSFVVEAPGFGAVQERRPWLGHWVILGALGIFGIAAVPVLNRVHPDPELAAVRRDLLGSGDFPDVDLTFSTRSGGKSGLLVTVNCKSGPADFEKTGSEIVAIVEKADPAVSNRDFISVDFEEGCVPAPSG